MDVRALLAGVLGVALGLVLLAAPEVVVRAHVAGRAPPGRGGEYGADGDVPLRWRWLVRLVGVVLLVVGVYLGAPALVAT